MARALTKHVIKHQESSFADWFSELRELAGDRWAEVSDQAPTCFAIWVGGGTPQQCLHMVAAACAWHYAETSGAKAVACGRLLALA